MDKDVVGNKDNKKENYVSVFDLKKLNDVGIIYHGISEGYQVFEIPNSLKDSEDAYNVYKSVLAKCGGRKEGAKIHICTMANYEHFNDYLEKFDESSYFVMYNMNDPLSPYQFHYESGELRDKNNKMVSEVMDIKKIINLTNFINTKNDQYNFNNYGYLYAITTTIMGEIDTSSAKKFFNGLIKYDAIEFTPEILELYIEFNSYNNSDGGYSDYGAYDAFKKLYDKNKINFKLNGNLIFKIIDDEDGVLEEMIYNNIVPIDNELYKSLGDRYNLDPKLLDYIISKKPDFFMINKNKHIDYLLGIIRNYKTGAPLLDDKFFIKSLYNEYTADFDPYYVISKIVSKIAPGKNVKNILEGFGEIGRRFYKEISSGDDFFYGGYYNIIFKNQNDFYYLADVFGEVAASNYFINLFKENETGFYPNRYKIKDIVKLSNNTDYIKNMKTFWNFIKENYPDKYENIYNSLVNET
jgi:hypothetical protein